MAGHIAGVAAPGRTRPDHAGRRTRRGTRLSMGMTAGWRSVPTVDPSGKPSWERVGDAMVGWCGYVLLVPATILGLLAGPKDPTWQATTLAIVAAAAAWTYLMFTRLPPPRQAFRLRSGLFFIGVLALAALLMLRMPLFFIYMISGFFYATILRPLPLAFVG